MAKKNDAEKIEQKLIEKVNISRHKRKSRYAASLGGILVFLATIGLISVAILSVNLTVKLLDNSKDKTMFEKMILPVMMFDPVPFESVQNIDPIFLLQTSLWSAVISAENNKYQFDYGQNISIPATDIDVAAAKLYGSEVKLQHQWFGNYETTYFYNDETQTYTVPIHGQIAIYTPIVEKISKKDDIYSLTVGYLASGNSWTQTITGEVDAPKPGKYMIYDVKKVKNGYNLVAIRSTPTDLENPPIG